MVLAMSGELDFSSNSWEMRLVVERKVPLQAVVVTSDLEFVVVSFQMSTLCMKCLIHVSGQAKVQSSRKCNKLIRLHTHSCLEVAHRSILPQTDFDLLFEQ